MQSELLIVEHDRKTRDLVSAFLTYQGYSTAVVSERDDIFDTSSNKQPRIVIADLQTLLARSPDFLHKAWEKNPDLVLIAYDQAESIRNLPHNERLLLIPKPLNLDELESVVMRAREYQALQASSGEPSTSEEFPHFLCSTIIGRSRTMLSLFEMLEKVAESNATVLIQGESGTGKELAARAIHQLSSRSSKNFVPVNCAAIPDELLESELFGHVKGAFTGAYANRPGRFDMADKGTLFLDEIGDMKANLQVKLLRVLQTKEFEPVGSARSQKVDTRIIAATNSNLEELVANKDFREDLYYRLSVIPITIPPLRERREDIPLLINHFLGRFNRDKRRLVKGFSREALEMLRNYDWPGNVRELENLVERMVTLKENEFEPVGSARSQKVDTRIIAATNSNLEELVANKDFREDLYYRLSVIPITIPPLRERREDIPLLINHFLGRFNRDKRRLVKGFSREALEMLRNYDWPGNVRELENLVERMVTLKENGFITPDDLPERYQPGSRPVVRTASTAQPAFAPQTEELPPEGICLNSAVDAFENRLILQALQRTGGNKKEAASLLNLKRTTLIEKLKKKNLQFDP